ncbi:cytochrome c biogenesis protein ResB, partial [Agromyces hippuratus]|uniref:cytochrome c biogenesis protein ResB n=1 Tax=Agromyces hippuratus TaxID=286438 RepID=UPI0035EA5647
AVPFLPQDANLTSIGVVKVPDGMPEQLGMVGFFYPTQTELTSGRNTSSYPDLILPVADAQRLPGRSRHRRGTPTSVYELDTSTLEQLSGGKTGVESIELKPGQTAELPNGLGTVTFDDVTPGRRPRGRRGRRPRRRCRRRAKLRAERPALRELRHPSRPDADVGAHLRVCSSSAVCSSRSSCRVAACGSRP